MDWVLIGVAAGAVYCGLQWRFARQELRKEHARKLKAWEIIDNLVGAINTLRSNCFIPNEKGHKVRYWDASVERREKAEGVS